MCRTISANWGHGLRVLALIMFLVWQPTGIASRAQAQMVNPPLTLNQSDLEVTPAEIDSARQMVQSALGRLQDELANQAIGAGLASEFQLSILSAQLQQVQPDVARLAELESGLRRLLPGRVQRPVDDLRHRVAQWRRLINLQSRGSGEVLTALEVFNRHAANSTLRSSSTGQQELRAAYAVLADTTAFADKALAIRKSVSWPNYSMLIKREFLEAVANRQFQVPVDFHSAARGTELTAHGVFHVSTRLELPVSQGESRLLVRASGHGDIGIEAERQRIQIAAHANPNVNGTQILHLLPRSIIGDPVILDAGVQARLASVQIAGLVGKMRLAQRFVDCVATKKLAENEPKISQQFEASLRTKVDEVGYELAYRINGLLKHSVWERLQSIEYLPDVELSNSALGIHSDTAYAYYDQLGALAPKPEVSSSEEQSLDMLYWLHESAVNNVLDRLRGLKLDEATMRGVWQVQLKLTSPEWESPARPRIPAVIHLARHQPLAFRLEPGRIQFQLKLEKCELDGMPQDVEPCEFMIEYRQEGPVEDCHFLRSQLQPLQALPAATERIWTEALDRFWGKSIRPLPRFPNASFHELMRVAHLEITDGWLVVGTRRVSPDVGAAGNQASREVAR